MRIVLDSNVMLVSIPKNSPYCAVYDSFLNEKYSLSISNEVLTEYIEVLVRFSTGTIANNIAEAILSKPNVIKADTYYRWNLITADTDDNKFVDLAIATNSDYIVTNDSHFTSLKDIDFPKVNVIDLDQFLEIIKNL
jgi:uncharacterized protein